MSKDETFVGRWARRKGEARTKRGGAAPVLEEAAKTEEARELSIDRDVETAAVEPGQPLQVQTPGESEPVDLDDLPDIDTLDENSDYSAFMREGVPTELRTSALRKLWRAKAFFGYRDGLNEYDDDYTQVVLGAKGYFESAYKAGRGYLADEERPDYVPPEETEPAGDGDDATVASESSEEDDCAEAQKDDVPDDSVTEVEDAEIDIGDAESDIDSV